MAPNELVFWACMDGIEPLIHPAADAAWAANQVVNHLGWDASTTENMAWDDWVDQLEHRFDDSVWSWAKDVAEMREAWPYGSVAQLVSVHHRWRERYDRLCGAYRRAGEIQDIGDLEPGEREIAVTYVATLDLLWSEAWWWRGWLGRYIHHRAKLGGG